MSHPDLDRLTSWVHGFEEPREAALLEEHVAGCEACRSLARELREEAQLLSREMGSPERLAALKEGILEAAGRRPSRRRGVFWQIPLAAAVLAGLVAVLAWPGPRHSLLGGRVALEDGRVLSAPAELAGNRPWQLVALEKAQVELSDRSRVDLRGGARFGLSPGGSRGIEANLSCGDAVFSVAPRRDRLAIVSPSGRVEAADGKFEMKIVLKNEGEDAMKGSFAGALITVFAGSVSLSTPSGFAQAESGQSAVLTRAEAPLLLALPQEKPDQQEELLRRLEKLAAQVANLEAQVNRLESQNQLLKTQLSQNPGAAPGGAVWVVNPGPGGASGPGGSAPNGEQVIIHIQGEVEKQPESKKPQENNVPRRQDK